MKKKISIMIIMAIILVSILGISLATEETTKNIELNLSGQSTIQEGTKTVEFKISLGNFTGIEDNVVLGYEAELNYDTDMFSSVAVEGLNGWVVTYEPTTKVLVGEVTTAIAKSNTDIAKITLTLKEGIEAGTSGDIQLNNLVLSGGDADENSTFNFNKKATITVESKEQENIDNGQNNNPPSEDTSKKDEDDSNKKISSEVKKDDTTITKNKMPYTGQNNILIIAFSIIIITGVFSFMRYKSIKIK